MLQRQPLPVVKISTIQPSEIMPPGQFALNNFSLFTVGEFPLSNAKTWLKIPLKPGKG
jgi:hypothetical protein